MNFASIELMAHAAARQAAQHQDAAATYATMARHARANRAPPRLAADLAARADLEAGSAYNCADIIKRLAQALTRTDLELGHDKILAGFRQRALHTADEATERAQHVLEMTGEGPPDQNKRYADLPREASAAQWRARRRRLM